MPTIFFVNFAHNAAKSLFRKIIYKATDKTNNNQHKIKGNSNMKVHKIKRRRVTFSLKAPFAKKVSLMADFNQWDESRHPMKKTERETWEKTVVIPPGQYEYKFLVDGNWQQDPTNETVRQNRFGTLNNLIIVKPA